MDDTAVAGGDAKEAAQTIRGIKVGDAEGKIPIESSPARPT
jgi:hypothetical protein